ncbi:MAG: M23 family metallopeptidase [Clostridia bacterium]|nr:M23 family metallopeptidase [Clostridia bacterium]
METKKQQKTKKNFFQKNIYYFVIAFVMLAFVAVTVVLFATNQNTNGLQTPNDNNDLNNPNTSVVLPNTDSSLTPEPDDSSDNKTPEPDKPTQTVITFIMPVENATLSCDYTASSVVYNQTLNVYTGHLAIDFKADAGTPVVVVYNGTIESVNSSYLTGTTITVDHGNGLKTVYNSVDAVEGLQAGMNVSQGQVIAYVSDNNRQEYKDGAHLHFEVLENGEKVSPYKYLTVSEK